MSEPGGLCNIDWLYFLYFDGFWVGVACGIIGTCLFAFLVLSLISHIYNGDYE